MSAKNRGAPTVAHDALNTDPRVAEACLSLLPIRPGDRVLEPSAGSGVWLDALAKVHGLDLRVAAVELQQGFIPELHEKVSRFVGYYGVFQGRFEDYMQRPLPLDCPGLGPGYDWIIGNPPYSHAESHIRQAMYLLRRGGHLAFLLRLNFRATGKRRQLFHTYRHRNSYVLEERPSFTADGDTDATEYALFVWQRSSAPARTTEDSFSWKNERHLAEDRRRILRLDWGVRDA
jgi:hypothetical protein